MEDLVNELSKLLAGLHQTKVEKEKENLVDLEVWFKKQDLDKKLWFMIMWFTLDQVRIIKYIHDLTKDIQFMTEALETLSKLEEESKEECPEEEQSFYI